MNPTPDNPPNFKIVRLAGSLHMTSGLLFTLGSCCWWSFSGRVQSPLAPDFSGNAIELIKSASAGQLWAMAAVCVLLIGGMANVAFGIGFQRPRRTVARSAKWSSGLIAAFFWSYLLAAIFVVGSAAGAIGLECLR